MATKTLTIVRPGNYGTRMLKAGDTFEATSPEARLFLKLGWMKEGRQRPAPVEAAAKPKAPSKRKAAAKK